MSDLRQPSSYIDHEVTAARIDRHWAAVRSRVPKARRFSWGWRVYAVACVVAVLVAGYVGRRTGAGPHEVLEGATFASSSAGQVITTTDGSRMWLGADAVVRVTAARDDRVIVALDKGDVTFDVNHVEGRAWVVVAGDYEVHVVGTRFRVRVDGATVSVDVERGRVDIVRASEKGAPHASIGAGESWRAGVAPVDSVAPPPPSSSPAATSAVEPPVSAAPVEPTSPPKPSWEELAKAKRFKDAYDALGEGGFASACESAGAQRLFELAEVARAAGKLADAERAFDMLRKRFRGDARAGLAAFELGRLRQDSLGKASAAAEALADAMALSPGAPFREDAEARRVRALEASGATAACTAARDAYLARYPSGVHAAVIRERCAGK